MTDLSYREAWAWRMLDHPQFSPEDDPRWSRITSRPEARSRLVAAWMAGQDELASRWHVKVGAGDLPTTFRLAGSLVEIEVGGIVVRSVPVADLLD